MTPASTAPAEPRRPRGDGWTEIVSPLQGATMWTHITGVKASSSVDDVNGDGPTWHVGVTQRSASGATVRAGRTAMRLARWAFDMKEAEEDNHGPVRVLRSLWLPVDPARRKPCACKAETPEEVSEAGAPGDRDAYVWRVDRRGAS